MKALKPGSAVWDTFITSVSKLSASGLGVHKIAEMLSQESGEKITWRDISKALETDKAKALVSDFNKYAFTEAKEIARRGAAKLVPKALQVISKNLDKNSLKAAEMIFETVGAVAKSEESTGSQNLTVVLPGAVPEPAIEVKGVLDETTSDSGD